MEITQVLELADFKIVDMHLHLPVSCDDWLVPWRNADCGLFATELSPSDDPCAYPYPIYNNFLVLDKSGYVAQAAEQTAEAVKGIRILMGLIPLIFVILAVVVLLFYPKKKRIIPAEM